jgi:hypothetical protein
MAGLPLVGGVQVVCRVRLVANLARWLGCD